MKNKKLKKKKNMKKHLTFQLYKMSKRSIPLKLKLNPTTCEEKLSFSRNYLKLFKMTSHKVLNLNFWNYN